jgi:hypothetical protein
MPQTALERLIVLVRRELGAAEVRVASREELAEPGPNELRVVLDDTRVLVALFDAAPEGREARERRLAMLLESFPFSLEAPRDARDDAPGSRRNASMSLQEELEALVTAAAAIEALVIDARSPVVWGDADPSLVGPPRASVIDLQEAMRARGEGRPSAPPPADDDPVGPLRARAMREVRALPPAAQLHKGATLHHVERAEGFGYLARSFAGIYVLVLVYDALFDELRAERAVAQSLPAIERLVLALPPLDPKPMGGAIALRRRRR